ncbi:MAG: glycosyltransferase, partial [Planctomycetota bacterium]
MKIAISLCTKDRPQMLAACLASLVPAVMGRDGVEVVVVVVENDVAPHSREVAEGFAGRLAIHYVLETEPGIPFARNRGVEEGLALGCDWLIFIDDDEFVAEDWLDAYLGAIEAYDADAFTGPMIRIYPDSAPSWKVDPPNLGRIPTGADERCADTSNAMVRADVIRPDGRAMRFDTSLRHTGGEDTEFFWRLTKAGGRIVWVEEAKLYEEVPESRLSLDWNLARAKRTASNAVRIIRMQDGGARAIRYALTSAAHSAALGGARIGAGLVYLPVDRARTRRYLWTGAISLSRVLGFLGGLFGLTYQPYRTIE